MIPGQLSIYDFLPDPRIPDAAMEDDRCRDCPESLGSGALCCGGRTDDTLDNLTSGR